MPGSSGGVLGNSVSDGFSGPNPAQDDSLPAGIVRLVKAGITIFHDVRTGERSRDLEVVVTRRREIIEMINRTKEGDRRGRLAGTPSISRTTILAVR